MKQEYTAHEIERIFKKKTKIPVTVEERIEDTYRALGLTGGTGRKRRGWRMAATVAVLAIGLMATGFAAVYYMNVRLQEENGVLSYDITIDPEVSEAHPITIRASYIPKGYVDEDGDMKWQNADTGASLTLISYNAAELYLASRTGDARLPSFDKDSYVKTVQNQDMTGDLFFTDSSCLPGDTEADKRLVLYNSEYGYMVEILSEAEKPLSDNEMIRIAEGLDIQVSDEVIPYPTDEEIALEKQIFEEAQEGDSWPDVTESDIYSAGDVIRDRNSFPDAAETEDPYVDIEYCVTDIQILDSLSPSEYPKGNYIQDYDSVVAPLLNEDGTLKTHVRYPADRQVNDLSDLETVGSRFIAVTLRVTNTGSDQKEVFLAPKLKQLRENGNGTLTVMQEQEAVGEAYRAVSIEGLPFYQSIQLNADDEKKHVFFTDLEAGETLEYTSVYVADEDGIDSAYLNFFTDVEALAEDGSRLSQPYVKITE